MAKHCVSAALSEASATTAVVAASMAAASMAAAGPARKQSSAAAWSRATADTGWWRSGRTKKARSRSLTVNHHPGKSSEPRRYKCGYIADSASSSGLDSWNSVSDAITWKHRESRGESIREGEDRSSKFGVRWLDAAFVWSSRCDQNTEKAPSIRRTPKLVFKVSVRSGRRILCRRGR